MKLFQWIKREYIIDSIAINKVLELYCFMFTPTLMALTSAAVA